MIFGHALIMLAIFALTLTFMKPKILEVECIGKLIFWLLIYFGIELLHTLERITAGCAWLYAKEPTMAEGRLFLFCRLWLYLGEAGWTIYGSTFVYDEEIDECESDSVKAGMTTLSIIDMISMLRLTTKILVIYGYLLILYLFCSCCIGLAVYKTYRSF